MTVRMYAKSKNRVDGNKETSGIDILQKALLKAQISFVLFPEIIFPKLSGFCLNTREELLMVLFFLKRKVKSYPGL